MFSSHRVDRASGSKWNLYSSHKVDGARGTGYYKSEEREKEL
jgi:hypothetical protein